LNDPYKEDEMTRKYWRILSILLVIALVVPAMAACQPKEQVVEDVPVAEPAEVEEAEVAAEPESAPEAEAVSYTHLTLPTSDLV